MRSDYKVLVNATTLVVGGGIQIGRSFVEIASVNKCANLAFLFIVSKPIYDSLSTQLQKDARVIVCQKSPAKLLKGRLSRMMLKRIETEFEPDVVYSIGFPSYVKFKNTEIGRYTNPWEINGELPWSLLSLKEKILTYVGIKYRHFWAKKADFFETQTESAKNGIIRNIGVVRDCIKVIPNSVNLLFSHVDYEKSNNKYTDDVNIFCLSAAYRHKNIELVPKVAYFLKYEHAINCKFILTVSKNSLLFKEIDKQSNKFDVGEMIYNVGPLQLEECLEYYHSSMLVFLPTLLEVFSATYLEAMALGKPIVTTDLEFAHDVCGDAAVYFQQKSPKDAADKIAELLKDKALQKKMIERGKIKFTTYPDPIKKHEIVFDWFKELASKK